MLYSMKQHRQQHTANAGDKSGEDDRQSQNEKGILS